MLGDATQIEPILFVFYSPKKAEQLISFPILSSIAKKNLFKRHFHFQLFVKLPAKLPTMVTLITCFFATLGDATQIEPILFVFYCPKKPEHVIWIAIVSSIAIKNLLKRHFHF